jgi:hypothetical protein
MFRSDRQNSVAMSSDVIFSVQRLRIGCTGLCCVERRDVAVQRLYRYPQTIRICCQDLNALDKQPAKAFLLEVVVGSQCLGDVTLVHDHKTHGVA